VSSPDAAPLVEVHLRDLPVQLWQQLQEHTDELLREFALMTSEAVEHEGELPVPDRLVALLHSLRLQYSGVTDVQREQLFAAAAAGVTRLEDVVYRVPPAAADAARALEAIFAEADAYCRSGEHLLTLATPPELVAFRRWSLNEFVRQLDGAPPVPWPEHAPAASS
jgi:hypothetical protein